VEKFIAFVEQTAGYFIGLLAIITFSEAILRYVFTTHIPDGFVVGQMVQGIAICWGIATATYADRHISVDIVYEFSGGGVKRICDVVGYTVNLAFLAMFSYAITFKVFDILEAGEISNDLSIPLWIGYTFASIGIICAMAMAAIRWWRVVVGRRPGGATRHG
jgi:TRAP-type C4-dicarboxylate transport system permease small subunit